MSPTSCAHPAAVTAAPGSRSLVCLDCGEAILDTGERQPDLFPLDAAEKARAKARALSARRARALLQPSLF